MPNATWKHSGVPPHSPALDEHECQCCHEEEEPRWACLVEAIEEYQRWAILALFRRKLRPWEQKLRQECTDYIQERIDG